MVGAISSECFFSNSSSNSIMDDSIMLRNRYDSNSIILWFVVDLLYNLLENKSKAYNKFTTR